MATEHVSRLEQKLQQIQSGFEHVDLKRPTVEIGGVALSPGEAATKAKSFLDLHQAVAEARAGYQNKLQARNAAASDAQAFVANTKQTLEYVLGPESPDLVLFGLKPKKPRRPLTPEERLARAAKLRETRKLRNTLGSRQRSALRVTAEPKIDVSFPSTGPAVAGEPSAPAPAHS